MCQVPGGTPTLFLALYLSIIKKRADGHVRGAMAFQKPHIVDLSKAIRLTDLRLNYILAQHAERLGELDAEDPTPPPHPAYASMSARPSSPAPLPGFTPDRLKRPRPSSPELLAAEADTANEEGAVDSSSNPSLRHGKKKKRPEKHKANRNAKRAKIQAIDGRTLKACALAISARSVANPLQKFSPPWNP
ncbi:hypothetical protein B0H19DRAFT_1371323 [Mycena capillaripes]|nr:hypothetical protein B0H19DRAFT_1371323 [Mycena capillaripes]